MPNKTKRCHSVILWTVLVAAGLCEVESLKTTFIEDICIQGGGVIKLHYENTGILMSAPELHPVSLDCEVILLPTFGHSVVLSISTYNVESGSQLTIEDSDHFKISLEGSGEFKDEKKSVISEGKITVRYRRDSAGKRVDPTTVYRSPMNGTAFSSRAGFQFTFTSVRNAPCINDEFACRNGKCISQEYLCDRHNHCGDNSDQQNCVPIKPTHEVTYAQTGTGTIWISVIGVGGAILFSVILVFIVVLVRQSKSRKVVRTTPNTNQNGGGGVPLQSVSSTVPAQRPGVESQGPPVNVRSCCSCTEPARSTSLYDRVRRSLRMPKDAKEDDLPVHQERMECYQVPSMYPSLTISPSAPDMHGIDNSDFKLQE